MKRLISSIVSLILLAMPIWAQQKIYVCNDFTYDLYEVSSTDDIIFSADGLEVSIGNHKTYKVEDIDSITFAEPQHPRIDIVYNGSSATVNVGANVKGVTYSVKGAQVTLTSNTTSEE